MSFMQRHGLTPSEVLEHYTEDDFRHLRFNNPEHIKKIARELIEHYNDKPEQQCKAYELYEKCHEIKP